MQTKQLGKFEIVKTLGSGATAKVKLAIDPDTKQQVALKVIKDGIDTMTKTLIMQEINAMSALSHPNVIKQISYGTDKYIKKSGSEKMVSYCALELASGGELLDFVMHTGRLQEKFARYFFQQLIEGLNYCHSNGFVHRDLKPDNLLLDHDFNLKIADFGFAAPVWGRDGLGNFVTKLGTPEYMSPELLFKQPYNGRSVDLFAAGMILFIMVTGFPPFNKAEPKDFYYKCVAANRCDIFWNSHAKNLKENAGILTKDFKKLFQAMVQLDAAQRPTMSEIISHPWMKGEVPDQFEVKSEFGKRLKEVKKKNELEKQQQKYMAKINGQMRSNEEQTYIPPKKVLDQFDEAFQTCTQLITDQHPDEIEGALLKHFADQDVKVSVNETKYKLKFNLGSYDLDKNLYQNDICIKLLKVDDTHICIEFQRNSGNKIKFHEHFKNIIKNVICIEKEKEQEKMK